METKTITLTSITIDDNLNVREGLDNETIERYMESFEQLPPVVVFDTGDRYLLADGFHRYEAVKKLGRDEIEAEIKQGTRQDAEKYAALANLQHGKPLTRAERRKAVERMLKLHTERANNWIAQDMGVSENTVKKYRGELESGSQIATLEKFIGKDGKEYPREIKHPKRDEQETEEHEAEAPLESTEYPQEAEEPEPAPLIVEEATTVIDDEQVDVTKKQTEQPIYHNDRFLALGNIREYISKPVEVATRVAGGGGVVKRGTILDIVEQDGVFMLDFETEDGEKRQFPTGTTTGEPVDEGILEIKIIDKEDSPLDEAETHKRRLEEREMEFWDIDADVEESGAATDAIGSQLEEIPETRYGDNERDTLGNPQGWDTFIERYNWLENYSFQLAANTNIDFIRRMRRIFENFVQKLEILLEDIART